MRRFIFAIVGGSLVAANLSGLAGAATKPTPKPVVAAVQAKAATPPPPKTHEVVVGDSLSAIAETEQLESWRPLWNANPELAQPDLIFAGQKLVVPQGTTTDRPLPADAVVPAPVAAATPKAFVRAASPAANYANGAGGILANIRMRESGGNYTTNTGNGYYGAYQFNLGTWRGVGGTGLPSEASPAEQDMRAQLLYNQRGCSPWPNTCY